MSSFYFLGRRAFHSFLPYPPLTSRPLSSSRPLSTGSSPLKPSLEQRASLLRSASSFLENLRSHPPPIAGSGYEWIGSGDLALDDKRRNAEVVKDLDLKIRGGAYRGEDAAASSLDTYRGEDAASSLDSLLTNTLDPAARLSMDDNSPGYMAFVPSGGLYHSSIADFISSNLNRYVTINEAAPALAAIEAEVIDFLCLSVAGYDSPGCGGVLTTGGSMANLVGVHCARRSSLGNADLPKATLYVSEQSHYCVGQSARFVGLQPRHVRLVPSLPDCTMDVAALRSMIEADAGSGLLPVAVCATAGTTNTGAVDDLQACADLCEEFGVWMHVDAAFGGAFRLTERGGRMMEGMERADSVVVDPHKGFFVPYGLGALLVKDRSKLLRANHEDGACMHPPAFFDGPGSDPNPDIMNLSPELTRDFRGLKLWLPLKLLGSSAFASELDSKLDLALLASSILSSSGAPHLSVCHAPTLTAFTFKLSPPSVTGARLDGLNAAFLSAAHRRGRCLLSTVRSLSGEEGELQLRACVLSFETGEGDVRAAMEDVVEAAWEVVEREGLLPEAVKK